MRAEKHIMSVIRGKLPWIKLARIYFLEFLLTVHEVVERDGPYFTIEEFREFAREFRLPKPGDPRAFGNVPYVAVKKNLCARTDMEAPTSNKRAHGRELSIWTCLP